MNNCVPWGYCSRITTIAKRKVDYKRVTETQNLWILVQAQWSWTLCFLGVCQNLALVLGRIPGESVTEEEDGLVFLTPKGHLTARTKRSRPISGGHPGRGSQCLMPWPRTDVFPVLMTDFSDSDPEECVNWPRLLLWDKEELISLLPSVLVTLYLINCLPKNLPELFAEKRETSEKLIRNQCLLWP